MYINKSILTLLALLAIFVFVFLKIHKDPEQTPETQVWITNNSGDLAFVTIEYSSEACPNTCRLELGTYAVNEGRGAHLPVPNEGDFRIIAKIGDQTLESEHEYVENWAHVGANIYRDRITLD